MKKISIILFIFSSVVTVAQSKNKQIVILTNRVDSLNAAFHTERENASQSIQKLNTTIDGLIATNGDLNSKITQLKNNISSLESYMDSLTKENLKSITDLEEMTKRNLELEANLKIQETNVSKFKIAPITVLPQWVENNACIDCIIYSTGALELSTEEDYPIFIYDIENDELYFILNGEEKRVPFYNRKEIENGYKLIFKRDEILINLVYLNCGFSMKKCVSLEIYNNDKLEFRDKDMTGF